MPNTVDIARIEGEVQRRIITLRGQNVLLDSDVAALYGVETRVVNQAVKNNPNKFPNGYIFSLENDEFENLRSKFLITNNPEKISQGHSFEADKQELTDLQWKISTTKLSKSRVLPKAFTEKGLYMLATILKSERAVQTTIAIVETFAKMRELARTMAQMSQTTDAKLTGELSQKGNSLLAELFDDGLQTTEKETEIEFNFAVMKIKHKIKRK